MISPSYIPTIDREGIFGALLRGYRACRQYHNFPDYLVNDAVLCHYDLTADEAGQSVKLRRYMAAFGILG